MLQSSLNFLIFVSSTLSDLNAKPSTLQSRVFLRLRQFVIKQSRNFQAIDLFWVVNEDISLNQQGVNICLGEIERCQRVTPRPNFIMLLDYRYGCCPRRRKSRQGSSRQL